MLDRIHHDLRLAARTLIRSPGVFAIAVLSLAIGIGANTTIFSAVDVFLLRPLPYPEAERIVRVWSTDSERGWTEAGLSAPDFLDLRRESRAVDVALHTGASFNVSGGEEPERLTGQLVSANLFGVLGVQPALGRGFLAEEEVRGAHRVVVLGDALWQRRFGGDPGVIGTALLLDGEPYTIVGVMPPDFRFLDDRIELWAPLSFDGTESRLYSAGAGIGRIRPGFSLEQAQAELSRIAAGLAAAYPDTNGSTGVRLEGLRDDLYNEYFRRAAAIVSTAVAFVLLIACANVANLLLARAATREREIAVRAALGAGRFRIVRQLLTESVLLSLCGGGLGLLLSVWGVRALVGIMPPFFFGIERIGIDGRVLAYTLGISVLAGILFGLAPALHASRPDLRESLKEGGRGSTIGGRRGRLRGALVGGEIALALVLLVAAGLLIKSYIGLSGSDLGFRSAGVMTFRIALPEAKYADSTAVIAFQERLVEQLGTLPGVEAAGAATGLPTTGMSSTYYTIEGEPPPPEGREPTVNFRGVTEGYFAALGIPLLSGRLFDERDRPESPPVVVVNRAFVERHWPGGDALGRRIVLSSGPREIVGVVGDVREWGPDNEPPAAIFLPIGQRAYRNVAFLLRTAGDAAALTGAARGAVAELDPDLPLYQALTMDEHLAEGMSDDAILARLLGIFGGIAVVLAVIGVYGVMAYSVAQRTQEVGIRMALGAQAGSIQALVLRQGAKLAAAGAAIGLLLALAVTRTLSAFLVGVSPFDAVTFAAVTLAILAAALAASWVPARRATRVDPLIALRTE